MICFQSSFASKSTRFKTNFEPELVDDHDASQVGTQTESVTQNAFGHLRCTSPRCPLELSRWRGGRSVWRSELGGGSFVHREELSVMTPLRQRVLDEIQRRNYAPTTARGYVLAIKQFAEYLASRQNGWAAMRYGISNCTCCERRSLLRARSKGGCRPCAFYRRRR